MTPRRVLIAITSYHGEFYSGGKNTGLCVVQAIQAHKVYKRKGYEVDFVSETGSFGIDEYSLLYDELKGEDKFIFKCDNSDFNVNMRKIRKPEDINAADYEIFYASLGYGCLFDYPNSKVADLAAEIYQNGGVIAAICHAQVMFDGLKEKGTDKSLIEGKVITGFTDIGEKLFQVYDLLMKRNFSTMREIAIRNGAKYMSPVGPFDDFSIADGRIVTGVNSASAASTALRTLTVIKEIKLNRIP